MRNQERPDTIFWEMLEEPIFWGLGIGSFAISLIILCGYLIFAPERSIPWLGVIALPAGFWAFAFSGLILFPWFFYGFVHLCWIFAGICIRLARVFSPDPLPNLDWGKLKSDDCLLKIALNGIALGIITGFAIFIMLLIMAR